MAAHSDTIRTSCAAFARGDQAISFTQHTDTVLVQRALQ